MINFIPNTPLKINWSSPISRGLVACFPFNEASGTTACNPALTSYGTLYGGAKRSSGPRGRSVFFDGSDDYMETSHNELINFDSTSPFSITFWIKMTNPANGAIIIEKLTAAPTYTGYQIHINSGGVAIFYCVDYSGGNRIITAYPEITQNDGKWHHIAITYNGNTSYTGIGLFTDGVVGSNDLLTGGVSGSMKNTIPLNIARRRSSNNNYFNGSLSLINIYNRVLSPTEVLASYRSPGSMFLQPRNKTVFLPSTTVVKTYNGLSRGSIKTMNAVDIASVKTINGLA